MFPFELSLDLIQNILAIGLMFPFQPLYVNEAIFRPNGLAKRGRKAADVFLSFFLWIL
jgi:hypothetical protein